MATIRAAGISKILKGIGLAIGSAVTFLLFVRAGFISVWILGSIAMTCVYGLWMVLLGGLKVLSPKSEAGDASEND
jgi:fatty acid desaturase